MQPGIPLLRDADRVLAALRRRGVDAYEVEAELPVDWLQKALHDTDAEVDTPGSVRLRLLLQPEGVVVAQGALTVAFAVPCGRCLAPAAVDGGTTIGATYMASAAISARVGQIPDSDDEELGLEDLGDSDVWPYDGPILSMSAMVAEQVALAYPMRALCERGDACRGLCSNCGYELNTVAAEVRQCPQCRNEVPLTPVADPTGAKPRQEREGDSPLAAALRRLQLE